MTVCSSGWRRRRSCLTSLCNDCRCYNQTRYGTTILGEPWLLPGRRLLKLCPLRLRDHMTTKSKDADVQVYRHRSRSLSHALPFLPPIPSALSSHSLHVSNDPHDRNGTVLTIPLIP